MGPADVDDLEFLVHFTRTLCVSLPASEACVDAIKSHVQARERVPAQRLELFVNGVRLNDDANVPGVPAIVRVRMTEGLCGGKGGFGAMLRSQGKGASGKPTTSFGACRDLHGRRLRHVNQEIALHKWRDEGELRAQRQKMGVGERELMEEETPSGIAGWYLTTPSWAEGIKKSYMKRRRNTVMCEHWLKARADGRTAPPHAPRWWGCPRGRDCDFAHGESELRGEGLTEFKRQKKEAHTLAQQQELHRYVNYEAEIRDDMQAAILQGRRQREAITGGGGGDSMRKPVSTVEEEMVLPVEATHFSIRSAAAIVPRNEEMPQDWLVAEEDSVGTAFQYGLCELRGRSNFGTATMRAACALTQGKWYYEVRLITEGVVQVGWADASFQAQSETGDGVGDHARSWAYDGCRQLKWNDGQEQEYGMAWCSGDVIGCLLDVDAGTVQFARNGELMEVAFDGIASVDETKKPSGETKKAKGKSSAKGKAKAKTETAKTKTAKTVATPDVGLPRGFFPAISAEKSEIVLVNIGAQPLMYAVDGFRPVIEGMNDRSKKTTATTLDECVASETTGAAVPDKTPVEQLTPTPAEQQQPSEPLELMDLDKYASALDLEALGLEQLKRELQHRWLKCGGTISERAKRLWAARGKPWDEIDPKMRDFKAMKSHLQW